MNKKKLLVEIREDLYNLLEKEREEKAKYKRKIIEEALEMYFGLK